MALAGVTAGTQTVAATTAPGAAQVAFSLLLVIGAIFALAILLRRVQGLRGGLAGAVKLHGGLQVGGRERVLLIEAQGRRVLIGVAPGQVRALHVFEPGEMPALPVPSASAPNAPASFAERLRALIAGHGAGGA